VKAGALVSIDKVHNVSMRPGRNFVERVVVGR
jgi:hypothetical protein